MQWITAISLHTALRGDLDKIKKIEEQLNSTRVWLTQYKEDQTFSKDEEVLVNGNYAKIKSIHLIQKDYIEIPESAEGYQHLITLYEN